MLFGVSGSRSAPGGGALGIPDGVNVCDMIRISRAVAVPFSGQVANIQGIPSRPPATGRSPATTQHGSARITGPRRAPSTAALPSSPLKNVLRVRDDIRVFYDVSEE